MPKTDFYQQLGLGIASIVFGMALSIFVYAATTSVQGASAWMLFIISFLIMLRCWWRYTTVFIQYAPSHTFWHFLTDFAIAFFGILGVLFVNNIRVWALLGGASMLMCALRCWLAKPVATARKPVRQTLWGAISMLIALTIVYYLAPTVSHTTLATAFLVIVTLFVLYTAKKP